MEKAFAICSKTIMDVKRNMKMKAKCFQNQIWFFFRNYYKYGAKVFWINVFLVCVLSPLGAIIGLNVQRNTVNAVELSRYVQSETPQNLSFDDNALDLRSGA